MPDEAEIIRPGNFFNPTKRSYEMTVRSENFVDKSEMLGITNSKINTDKRFICVSRLRRLGKTVTVNMIAAYYSFGGNSSDIFGKLSIVENNTYSDNLNKYNVIRIDM